MEGTNTTAEEALEEALEELLFDPANAELADDDEDDDDDDAVHDDVAKVAAAAAAHLAEVRSSSTCSSTTDFVLRKCLFFRDSAGDGGLADYEEARAFLLRACALGGGQQPVSGDDGDGDGGTPRGAASGLTAVEATRRALGSLAVQHHSIMQPRCVSPSMHPSLPASLLSLPSPPLSSSRALEEDADCLKALTRSSPSLSTPLFGANAGCSARRRETTTRRRVSGRRSCLRASPRDGQCCPYAPPRESIGRRTSGCGTPGLPAT